MESFETAITDQTERIYKNALYSATIQFESAKIYRRRATIAGAVSTVAATAGGLGLLASPSAGYALLAFTAALSSFLAVTGDPSGKAKQAEIIGHEYIRLRNDARSFADIDLSTISPDSAKSKFKELRNRENLLNCQGTLAPDGARKTAKNQIEKSN